MPELLNFDNITIKVVDRFKLLGVTIDSNLSLNFLAYSSILKKNVAYKLHSI